MNQAATGGGGCGTSRPHSLTPNAKSRA